MTPSQNRIEVPNIHAKDFVSHLRAVASEPLVPQSQLVTASWQLSWDSISSNDSSDPNTPKKGISLACLITPTDSSYGVGFAAVGLFSINQQTCYCAGLSWANPNGLITSGQIGVPLTVIGATDLCDVKIGDTFTAIANGTVYSPTDGCQEFNVVTTLTFGSSEDLSSNL